MVPFVLTCSSPCRPPAGPLDPSSAPAATKAFSTPAAGAYHPTGGIVNAPTTSLPETISDKGIGTIASAGIWTQPGDGIRVKRTTTNIKNLQAKSHPAFPSSRRTRPPENPDAKTRRNDGHDWHQTHEPANTSSQAIMLCRPL